MRVIRWSVDHSFGVFSFYAVVLFLSVITLWKFVPLRLNPSIKSPQLAVLVNRPGWPAKLVESEVTDRIEPLLAQVPKLQSLRSSSMAGMSLLVLEFPYGHDPESSVVSVSTALAEVDLGQTGDEEGGGHTATAPRVFPYNPLKLPLLRLAVRADDWDAARLADWVEKELLPRLRRLPGVEEVWSFGVARPEVEIAVDRDKLATLGLSLSQVRQAIEDTALPRASGTLDSPGRRSFPIVLEGQAKSLPELGNVILATVEGRPVTLERVASLSRTLVTEHSNYRYNGRQAIEINVLESAYASSPRLAAAVNSELSQIRQEFSGLSIEVAYDNAHFVTALSQRVWWELALAVILTGLVAYLFLGDWRGTGIVLATIPTTLALTVLCFPLLGLSFNSSTLVGLLLAIGRLVDDTIIDLCAVARLRAFGKSSHQAAVDGCSGVRRAVVSATLVIVVVMLPLTMTGGLTQDMFEGIVWPYLLAVLASLVVALTLSPALMAVVYQGVGPVCVRSPAERALAGLERRYRALLAKALRCRVAVLGGAVVAVYLALCLVPLLGWEMMPAADTGQLYVMLEARPGTPLEETTRMAAKVEAILRRQPEVRRVSTEIGMSSLPGLSSGYAPMGSHMACMFVTLSDMGQRQRSLWEIADAAYIQATLTVANIRQLSIKEVGSDVMATSMSPVQLVIKGPDLLRLAHLAEESKELAYRSEALAHPTRGLIQVATSWSVDSGARTLVPDLAALSALELSSSDLAGQTAAALDGEMTNCRMRDGTPVKIAYQVQQRRSLDDLKAVVISGSQGAERLDRLARIESDVWPSMIEHVDLQRSNSVVAGYRKGGPGSMVLGMEWLMASRMQLGLPPGYSIEQRGDMVTMMDSSRRLFQGIGLSLLLMYSALALQFRSASLPLAIMAAIPLSLPGVFLALLLAQQTLSTVSILGFAVLVGMDVTTSILLLDAVSSRHRIGHLWRAILKGAPSRLRPVLMTMLVTLAVLAPLAFFPQTGTDAYAPLATVIVGGLTVSGVLTLVLVPVLYSLIRRR